MRSPPPGGKSDHNVLAYHIFQPTKPIVIFSVIKEGSGAGGGGAFILVKHCDRIVNGQFVDGVRKGRRLLFVLSLLSAHVRRTVSFGVQQDGTNLTSLSEK